MTSNLLPLYVINPSRMGSGFEDNAYFVGNQFGIFCINQDPTVHTPSFILYSEIGDNSEGVYIFQPFSRKMKIQVLANLEEILLTQMEGREFVLEFVSDENDNSELVHELLDEDVFAINVAFKDIDDEFDHYMFVEQEKHGEDIYGDVKVTEMEVA